MNKNSFRVKIYDADVYLKRVQMIYKQRKPHPKTDTEPHG